MLINFPFVFIFISVTVNEKTDKKEVISTKKKTTEENKIHGEINLS